MPRSRSGTGRSLGDPYRQLWLVSAIQVLATSVWFATAAVVPSLISAWRISPADA